MKQSYIIMLIALASLSSTYGMRRAHDVSDTSHNVQAMTLMTLPNELLLRICNAYSYKNVLRLVSKFFWEFSSRNNEEKYITHPCFHATLEDAQRLLFKYITLDNRNLVTHMCTDVQQKFNLNPAKLTLHKSPIWLYASTEETLKILKDFDSSIEINTYASLKNSSPLFYAARIGDSATAQKELATYEPEKMYVRRLHFQLIARHAIESGHASCLQLLLPYVANKGELLAYAIHYGSTACVELLLQDKVNPNETYDPDDDCPYINGLRYNTPLTHAAAQGKAQIVRLLLTHRAHKTAVLPLFYAYKHGHGDVAAALLEKLPDTPEKLAFIETAKNYENSQEAKIA